MRVWRVRGAGPAMRAVPRCGGRRGFAARCPWHAYVHNASGIWHSMLLLLRCCDRLCVVLRAGYLNALCANESKKSFTDSHTRLREWARRARAHADRIATGTGRWDK